MFRINKYEEKVLQEIIIKMCKESQKEILKCAIKEGLISKKEYEKKYKGRYFVKEYNACSFIEYLGAILTGEADYFVTENKNMLKDREKLAKKFGLRIISPEEADKMMQEEHMQDTSYIG